MVCHGVSTSTFKKGGWEGKTLTQRAVRGIPSLSISSGSNMPSWTESTLLSSAMMGKGSGVPVSPLKAITSYPTEQGYGKFKEIHEPFHIPSKRGFLNGIEMSLGVDNKSICTTIRDFFVVITVS